MWVRETSVSWGAFSNASIACHDRGVVALRPEEARRSERRRPTRSRAGESRVWKLKRSSNSRLSACHRSETATIATSAEQTSSRATSTPCELRVQGVPVRRESERGEFFERSRHVSMKSWNRRVRQGYETFSGYVENKSTWIVDHMLGSERMIDLQ